MKAFVNQESCIGCGICETICPEVFEIRDDGKSYVIIDPIPEELINNVLEAEEECPVSAISHEL